MMPTCLMLLILQLKAAFEDLSSKQSEQEQVLIVCRDKDMGSTKMISDLTQV